MQLLQYDFFQNALIGMTLISVACAVIGVYVVTRRMVFIAGGITHTCFGGLGLGYYLGWNPLLAAAAFAIGGGLSVDAISRGRVRRDSAIAVVWAVGMALGILFIFLTPGYVPELNAFLFGNVLNITRTDLWVFAAFATAAVALFAAFGRVIMAVSFDEDFARTRYLPVRLVNTVMMIMVATCIVLTIKMIGVMLLMSMMSLPQMVAEQWCRRYSGIMLFSAAASIASCLTGLWLSVVTDVPASAMIVLVQAALFFISNPLTRMIRRR